jgi:hypothetical protein
LQAVSMTLNVAQVSLFGRYLAIYVAGAFLLALAVGAWSGYSLRQSEASLLVYDYQLDKLAHTTGEVTTLFVGDSSLGNAIDAKLFGELEGAPAMNLALTASYGYAGSYNMLRRALTRLHPRNVVIVQAADLPKREASNLAALLVGEEAARNASLWERLTSPVAAGLEYIELIYNVGSLRRSLAFTFSSAPGVAMFAGDYPVQRGQIKPTVETVAHGTLRPGVNRNKLPYLDRIAALCREEHLNCIYAHGPLYDGICAASRAYLAEVSTAIRDTGLEMAPGTPLCLPADQLGDSIYHASPSFKAQATREYYWLLKPLLQ